MGLSVVGWLGFGWKMNLTPFMGSIGAIFDIRSRSVWALDEQQNGENMSTPIPSLPPAYLPHPHHRDPSRRDDKSQWLIPVPDEVACFHAAYMSNWGDGGKYWGLHAPNGLPQVLGTTPVSPFAYIAKFVGPVWHGYPVAHWIAPYDRPGMAVLNRWEQSGIIGRLTKSKIRRGKKCVL